MNMIVLGVVLVLMAFGYQWGVSRSRAVAGKAGRRLHSLPRHYGVMIALWCGIPALILLTVWTALEPTITRSIILSDAPAEILAMPAHDINATVTRVRAIASGYGVANQPTAFETTAASELRGLQGIFDLALIAVIAAISVLGLVYASKRINPELRARNEVERVVRVLLIACSGVAILTTFGIVLSMLGETLRFFTFVNPLDFFFGLNWNPRFSTTGSGSGDYGLIPLLWGTIMITIIAMLVAVPLGLLIAIYLSEYAGPRVRAIAKPVVELLAGIPTIVFGFFALTTIGPMLTDLGALIGLQVRSTSALTAGLVMGIMIIPFVSSLSDDIITQVPRALRDGSLGLGATRSETMKRVILPAALPGIVGAFLLAISRAIGETMIVVMAAGNSPVLQGNPLESVSTVTVTIVNQLTGDLDFASPQSLVAFALGLTLFAITLGLNVVALYVVRKYREQYE